MPQETRSLMFGSDQAAPTLVAVAGRESPGLPNAA